MKLPKCKNSKMPKFVGSELVTICRAHIAIWSYLTIGLGIPLVRIGDRRTYVTIGLGIPLVRIGDRRTYVTIGLGIPLVRG
jgi:ABC-type transport system involved in cytochrome c biogenesis permease subunit